MHVHFVSVYTEFQSGWESFWKEKTIYVSSKKEICYIQIYWPKKKSTNQKYLKLFSMSVAWLKTVQPLQQHWRSFGKEKTIYVPQCQKGNMLYIDLLTKEETYEWGVFEIILDVSKQDFKAVQPLQQHVGLLGKRKLVPQLQKKKKLCRFVDQRRNPWIGSIWNYSQCQ